MNIINHKRWSKVIPKNVSAERPYSYRLSDDQLQYYRENGFLVIRKLIDVDELNKFKEHFTHICKGLESPGNMTVVKERSLIGKGDNIENCVYKLQDIQFDDVFMTYCENPLILDVVAQVIGDDITVSNGMFINKPPGSSEHPPHQDFYYAPIRSADHLVGIWTAIDNATVENGCMWAVPSSHTDNKLYPHYNFPGVLKVHHSISDQTVAPSHKRVLLEMAPGDTLLINSLLVHGSGPNNSKKCRQSIASHYSNSKCEYLDVRGTDQEFIGKVMQAEARKRGLEGLELKDIWRLTSKKLKRKSQL